MPPSRPRHRVVAAALALGCAMLVQSLALASHSEPLRAQWHFDTEAGDQTPDSTGHGLDGALLSGATLVSGGRLGYALDLPTLSQTGSRVDVADSSELESAQITALVWVKSDGTPGSYKWVLAKGGEDCLGASYGFTTGAGAGLQFAIFDGAGSHVSPDVGAGLWDGRWHAVAGSYDGATLRIFVDGAEVGVGTATDAGIAYGLQFESLNIGNYPGSDFCGFDYTFPGLIDEAKIYGRSLSATEIAALADLEPAETTITSGAQDGEVVGDLPPTFTFESSEPQSSFECRTYDPDNPDPLDPNRAFRPCDSPHSRADLAAEIELGERSVFEVRATDAAGNPDPTPATRTYRKHGELGEPPPVTRCTPVAIKTTHGEILANCPLVRLRNDKVPCVHAATYKVKRCEFNRKSDWVESKRKGDWAVVGQPISPQGRRKGPQPYVIAAPVGNERKFPCAAEASPGASSSDSAGTAAGSSLAAGCAIETVGASWNASGLLLQNYATREVCTSSYPHPDNATLTRIPSPGIYCYTGTGAALNDPNGLERDIFGVYLGTQTYCHKIYVASARYEIPAAKIPQTTSRWPPKVIPGTPLVWRSVSSAAIAN